MNEPTKYPLCWPSGVPRTRFPKTSRFGKRTVNAALTELDAELRRLAATHVVRSSNLPLRIDGLPRADVTPGEDHGIAIYFRRRDVAHVIACDAYRHIRDNAYAIAKTIEALRAIERYGSAQLADQAFSSFKALPAAEQRADAPRVRPWREVLGVPEDLDREGQLLLAESRFRKLTQQAHPDRGGSVEAMEELNGAITRAREALR